MTDACYVRKLPATADIQCTIIWDIDKLEEQTFQKANKEKFGIFAYKKYLK